MQVQVAWANTLPARTLAVVGDRWTLLVIRDLFLGVRRFSDLQASLGINKHRLSDRLNKLQENDIIEKRPSEVGRKRLEYVLTGRGLDLYPVLISLVQWGDEWAADENGQPMRYRHKACGEIMRPQYCCDQCGAPLEVHQIEACPGPAMFKVIEQGGTENLPLGLKKLMGSHGG